MEEAQGGLERGNGVAPSGGTHLFHFEIPIAEFVPEEVPETLGEFVVAVLVDGAVGLLGDGIETGEDPAIFNGGLRTDAGCRMPDASGWWRWVASWQQR